MPSSLTPKQLCLEKPKFLIIELPGTDDWLDNLKETTQQDLCLKELMQFYLTQFRWQQAAVMNMEYSLMEMYNNYDLDESHFSTILTECRNLGLKVLKHLESLGVYRYGQNDYCFARILQKDTFMFWRPSNVDVDG